MGNHTIQDALLGSTESVAAGAISAQIGDKLHSQVRPQVSPIPLGNHSGRTSDFPLHCLGSQGQAAAEALQELTQAPKGLCAQGVLTAMSTAVSGWGWVESIAGTTYPISLYLTCVAQSGERNTAVDGLAQKGIRVFESELANECREARQAAKATGEEMEDLPDPSILVNDATYEGLLLTLSQGPGFGCLSNDDAAGFWGGYSMGRDQRQKMLAGLSQLHSGSLMKRSRMHGKAPDISGKCLTIGLMFQPYLIGQVFGDREMVEQGFLPRILPCFPVSTMGTRFFRKPDPRAKSRVEDFGRHSFKVLDAVRAQRAVFLPPDDPFAPSVPVLSLSAGAHEVLRKLHDELEEGLADGGRYSTVRGFAGRATEHATRLAAVITLFDDISAQEVSRVAAEAGAELARFYLAEFQYLHRLGKAAKDQGAAVELGRWLRRQYGPGGLGHDKDVSQYGPAQFRKAGDRRTVLETLAAHHWIEMLQPGTVVDGSKRQVAFRVNPAIDSVL